MSLVVCKGNIIMLFFSCSNWGWPPQITMDLTSKFSGLLAFLDLHDRLSCCLHIHIRFTKSRFGRHCLQLYSSHEALVDELSCDFKGNMTHLSMELVQGEHFLCYIPFVFLMCNLVETIAILRYSTYSFTV